MRDKNSVQVVQPSPLESYRARGGSGKTGAILEKQ